MHKLHSSFSCEHHSNSSIVIEVSLAPPNNLSLLGLLKFLLFSLFWSRKQEPILQKCDFFPFLGNFDKCFWTWIHGQLRYWFLEWNLVLGCWDFDSSREILTVVLHFLCRLLRNVRGGCFCGAIFLVMPIKSFFFLCQSSQFSLVDGSFGTALFGFKLREQQLHFWSLQQTVWLLVNLLVETI